MNTVETLALPYLNEQGKLVDASGREVDVVGSDVYVIERITQMTPDELLAYVDPTVRK